jgi:hypothetical protein
MAEVVVAHEPLPGHGLAGSGGRARGLALLGGDYEFGGEGENAVFAIGGQEVGGSESGLGHLEVVGGQVLLEEQLDM